MRITTPHPLQFEGDTHLCITLRYFFCTLIWLGKFQVLYLALPTVTLTPQEWRRLFRCEGSGKYQLSPLQRLGEVTTWGYSVDFEDPKGVISEPGLHLLVASIPLHLRKNKRWEHTDALSCQVSVSTQTKGPIVLETSGYYPFPSTQ